MILDAQELDLIREAYGSDADFVIGLMTNAPVGINPQTGRRDKPCGQGVLFGAVLEQISGMNDAELARIIKAMDAAVTVARQDVTALELRRSVVASELYFRAMKREQDAMSHQIKIVIESNPDEEEQITGVIEVFGQWDEHPRADLAALLNNLNWLGRTWARWDIGPFMRSRKIPPKLGVSRSIR